MAEGDLEEILIIFFMINIQIMEYIGHQSRNFQIFEIFFHKLGKKTLFSSKTFLQTMA